MQATQNTPSTHKRDDQPTLPVEPAEALERAWQEFQTGAIVS